MDETTDKAQHNEDLNRKVKPGDRTVLDTPVKSILLQKVVRKEMIIES